MIILIFLIMIIIGFFAAKMPESKPGDISLREAFTSFGELSGMLLVLVVLILIVQYATMGLRNDIHQEEYASLTYKLESGACVDDFGLLKKEIVDEIQDWNEDIGFAHAMKDNFWVGVLFPDMYEGLTAFDYEDFNTNND